MALALMLSLTVHALHIMKKPKETKAEKEARLAKKERQAQWKVATVEGDWEKKAADPSKPDEKGIIRPRFEILPTNFEVGGSKTVEIFWQRPKTDKIKGVFFGATGCFHQGGDFFYQKDPQDGWEFEGCHKSKAMRCQGMPDNVYAFKYAMERDYLVMTTTPQDKNSCWNHELDPKRTDEAIKYVLHIEGLNSTTPVVATGASQGGYFMFDMQEKKVRNLKCIAPQCAEMKWKTHAEHLPTMMIWMPKDFNLTNPIRETIDYLRRDRKVRVAERTPHAWKVHELMKARGFSDEVADKVKKRLFNAKGQFGHRPVTKGGHLIDHPGTQAWWQLALRPIPEFADDNFVKDHSIMHHLLQVAYAEHEFTAEYTDHIIDFCEGHEDAKKELRFGRKPDIQPPKPEAVACSPNCPPPEPPKITFLFQQQVDKALKKH